MSTFGRLFVFVVAFLGLLSQLTFLGSDALKLGCNPVTSDCAECEAGDEFCQDHQNVVSLPIVSRELALQIREEIDDKLLAALEGTAGMYPGLENEIEVESVPSSDRKEVIYDLPKSDTPPDFEQRIDNRVKRGDRRGKSRHIYVYAGFLSNDGQTRDHETQNKRLAKKGSDGVRSRGVYDFIDYLRDDNRSTDFYEPAEIREQPDLLMYHAEANEGNRKPFGEEVGYSVADKVPLENEQGYIQEPCGCPRSDCRKGYSDPSSDKYWFIRHRELCFRKGLDAADHYRNIKKLESYCNWNDPCSQNYYTQPLCYNSVTKFGLTTAEKYGLLFYHNLLRARRAEGKNVGRVGPRRCQVPGMMEVEWDAHLADKAQRLVNSCTFSNDCSFCRNTGFEGNVGQILFNVVTNHTFHLEFLLKEMLYFAKLSKNETMSFKGTGGTGLMGQMLWEGTSHLGCGLLQHKLPPGAGDTVNGSAAHSEEASGDGSATTKEVLWETMVACNYYPAGNEVGQPVVRRGAACSGCPSGTRCSSYSKVLCSRFYRWSMDGQHPEEAEQFFALTEEEQRLRVEIIDIIFKSARNKNEELL